MKLETKVEKINGTKSWFFEKTGKIDKRPAGLTREKQKMQITSSRNETRDYH